MLMVDRVVELEPHVRAVGIKCVSVNEPHFQGHYPGRPIMPGVLIVEAMAQVGGLAVMSPVDQDGVEDRYEMKTPVLAAVDKAKFRRPVVPGDVLKIEATVLKSRGSTAKISANVTVDGVVVAEAELLFTLIDSDRL